VDEQKKLSELEPPSPSSRPFFIRATRRSQTCLRSTALADRCRAQLRRTEVHKHCFPADQVETLAQNKSLNEKCKAKESGTETDGPFRATVGYSVTAMSFHPTITFEQYRDTCKAVAAAKPNGARKRSWKGYVVLGVACLTLGLSPQIPAARVPALAFIAILTLCWILSKPLARRSQDSCFRTIYSEEQESLNDQVLTVDESGISCNTGDGKATSHHTWSAFIKRIDMPDAYVFLPSPNSFIRVPKEMLTMSELELVLRWDPTVPSADGR
jgi:hypothetical protein